MTTKILTIVLAITIILSVITPANVISIRMDWTNYEAGEAEYECQMVLAERGDLDTDEIAEICQP